MDRNLRTFKSISHIADDFDPVGLDQVVFPTERTESYLVKWMARKTSTRNLLIYGEPGTGKTRAAYLMALERTRILTGWDPVKYVECESGTADKLLQEIKDECFSFARAELDDFEQVVILDEVDNFKQDRQRQLKKVLELNDRTFVLLTNNLSDLDSGLRDRCYEISWNVASFERCEPRLAALGRTVLGRDLSVEELRSVWTTAGWRQMLRNFDTLDLAA
jgi:replication-associated recombination protein RarA